MKTISINSRLEILREVIMGLYSLDARSQDAANSKFASSSQHSIVYQKFFTSWKVFSLVNLVLVATAGVLLRAKILFPLPWIDHKFLLHAHSHFAFSGWLGQIISVVLIETINRSVHIDIKKVRLLFLLNAFASFGMLFTFPFIGYAPASIFFSTLSLLYSIWFPIAALGYINKASISLLARNCFTVALISLMLSTAGPITLAVGKALGIQGMEFEVKSVYWFLHFQYNGFFFFSVAGLYCSLLSSQSQESRLLKQAFVFFAFSLLPAYLLSIQWLGLSPLLQAFASISGVLQVLGLIQFIRYLWDKGRKSEWLYTTAFIAFLLKIVFQFLSVFPAMGKIAFGFRPIVIGYLHLVLLGLMTTFMLGFLGKNQRLKTNPGLVVFVTAIIVNELALFFQGLMGIMGTYVHGISELLFVIALLLLVGTGLILRTAVKSYLI
jgi:hypothetical protein